MILHVLAPGRVGGLESVVRLLASGQARRGHPVAAALVLDPGGEDHPLITPLSDAGVLVEPLVIPARAYRTEWIALRAVIGRVGAGIVHTHGYRADVLAGGAARAADVPTLTTVHGFTGSGRKKRFYEWLQAWAFRRASAVVAVSRPLVDRLIATGVERARIHCIPNAWAMAGEALSRGEARARLGLGPDVFVIGWVGRITEEKGLDVFLRAVALLPTGDVIASIIGDGPERSAAEALAAELGVAERLMWHGTVADAGQHFRAFDAFVLSSRTEGTPIALFEAMSAGVPVVATAVGGVPDVAGGGAGALLVPPEDPVALAAGITAVRADSSTAAVRAAAASRRLTDAYGVEPWLDRYDALYDRIRRE